MENEKHTGPFKLDISWCFSPFPASWTFKRNRVLTRVSHSVLDHGVSFGYAFRDFLQLFCMFYLQLTPVYFELAVSASYIYHNIFLIFFWYFCLIVSARSGDIYWRRGWTRRRRRRCVQWIERFSLSFWSINISFILHFHVKYVLYSFFFT